MQTNQESNNSALGYPLEGVKVVDFTHVLSGPYCTMLMADLGADVIKIERPGRGDENRRMRTYEGRTPDDEDYFYPMNRNKRSIEMDLKDPAQHERLEALLREADVVVENFTPGAMRKLKLDYESVRKLNETVIYCSISGYGQTGPYRDRRAYDSIIQAVSGVMSITGAADGPPARSGLMFADLSGAMYAFAAIVTSLYAREKSRKGNYIDLSMSDALLSLYSTNAAEYLAVGRVPRRAGSENPGRSPTGSYICADGKFIQIMGGSDNLWPRFCKVLEIEGLVDDPRFTSNEVRIENRDALRALLAPVIGSQPSEYWVDKFNGIGVPAAPINTLADVLHDDHFRAREMELKIDHPKSGTIRTINNPFRFSAYRTWKTNPPPILGQHNDDL